MGYRSLPSLCVFYATRDDAEEWFHSIEILNDMQQDIKARITIIIKDLDDIFYTWNSVTTNQKKIYIFTQLWQNDKL